MATTVYNPRQLRGGGGLIEPKYYEGGHCQSVLRSHRFFCIHPLMSWGWHRHLTGSCKPQDNTLPCVWWGNPLTPNKHCHRGSAHPGRTEVIYDLATTVCAMSSHHWPCNTSWEHSMSHNIYYMSHTIDKWNLYCSYTIKYIFVSLGIPRDLTALKKNNNNKIRTTAPLFQRDADENQEC